MLRWFETRLDPYPSEFPRMPPRRFWDFCLHYMDGTKRWLALMALTADIVARQGVSVLFTEHDMDVVFAHADRVMVLNRGELLAAGPVEAVRADPRVQETYLGGGTMYATDGAGGAHA